MADTQQIYSFLNDTGSGSSSDANGRACHEGKGQAGLSGHSMAGGLNSRRYPSPTVTGSTLYPSSRIYTAKEQDCRGEYYRGRNLNSFQKKSKGTDPISGLRAYRYSNASTHTLERSCIIGQHSDGIHRRGGPGSVVAAGGSGTKKDA